MNRLLAVSVLLLGTSLLWAQSSGGHGGWVSGHGVSTALNCADTSSSATTYTCSTNPGFAPSVGDVILLTSINQNNSGSATLAVNGAPGKTIKKQQNAANLVAGDLQASGAVVMEYDGTYWQMQGQIGNAASFPLTVSGTVTSGGIPYFNSTTNEASSGILNTDILVKGGGAGGAPTNSSITDNGTTVSTPEPIQVGTATCTTFGTAGGMCPAEGTAPMNVSGAAPLYPDSTAHEYMAKMNGSASPGMMVRSQPGAIRSTGLTASVTTATLCAAAAGACNVAGEYHVHFAVYQSGTACTANTTNGVSVQLTWTDANGTAHSAQTLPMNIAAGALGTSGVMPWNATTLGAWGSADANIDTNGTIIQYATTYANCATGTATYAISGAVTRLQ